VLRIILSLLPPSDELAKPCGIASCGIGGSGRELKDGLAGGSTHDGEGTGPGTRAEAETI